LTITLWVFFSGTVLLDQKKSVTCQSQHSVDVLVVAALVHNDTYILLPYLTLPHIAFPLNF